MRHELYSKESLAGYVYIRPGSGSAQVFKSSFEEDSVKNDDLGGYSEIVIRFKEKLFLVSSTTEVETKSGRIRYSMWPLSERLVEEMGFVDESIIDSNTLEKDLVFRLRKDTESLDTIGSQNSEVLEVMERRKRYTK